LRSSDSIVDDAPVRDLASITEQPEAMVASAKYGDLAGGVIFGMIMQTSGNDVLPGYDESRIEQIVNYALNNSTPVL
jgi:hypothetical protein